MSQAYAITIDDLRDILANLRHPEQLDSHHWAESLTVQQASAEATNPGEQSKGMLLIQVVGKLFRQMMPSTPPRRGKRLDTRWSQFGMLAAEYFAPFYYGTPYPSTLRDAWGRMDEAIPYFVFGKSGEDVPESEAGRYRLFGDDTEPAPISTLSDWHIKGLQRLTELFLNYEKHLSQKLSQPSPVLHPPSSNLSKKAGVQKISRRPAKRASRWGCLILVVLLLAGMLVAGNRALYIYKEAKTVKSDLQKIQDLLKTKADIATFGQAGPLISSSRQDLAVLQRDVEPFLWTGKYLTWVPTYGGDLSQAEPLLDMASAFLATADESIQGATPLWRAVYDQAQPPKLTDMTQLLVQAQPDFSKASLSLNAVIAARGKLNLAKLSPSVRNLVSDKIDPNLPLLQEGLTFAMALPKLTGASDSGPQTYLIFFQNEDELRATGGFLTDVGTIVIKDGNILSSNFEDSYALDDLTKPYPVAPWQLEQYMQAHMLLLRDSNWSPDFPTSAALEETLYAYTRYHTSDGIIAVDQRAVQMLLTVLGPITLEGVSYPITSENVIAYMREAKFNSGNQHYDPTHRKDFIATLGEAILARISSGKNTSLESLSKVLVEALDQKHILLQAADPAMENILAKQGWDGAVRPGTGDFLMVVDSNVGFTKSNPVIGSKFLYDVDLTRPTNPIASLRIIQTNDASGNAACKPFAGGNGLSYQSWIDLCYLDYLRVYVPAGTQLLGATPHSVPGEAMLDGVGVPARVDKLKEGLPGVQSFGTLLLVPIGASLETDFQFALPSEVIQESTDLSPRIYALRVQKQPGTLAIPITICIRFPVGTELVRSSPAGKFEAGQWCMDGDLNTDIHIILAFTPP